MGNSTEDVLDERRAIGGELGSKTLLDFLERNAEEQGDRVAVSWRQGNVWKTVTWRVYRDRTLEVAAGLMSLGVGQGEPIGITCCNRMEHALAMLGSMLCGALPTSIYMTLSPEQIQHIAQDSGCRVIILENGDLLQQWLKVRELLPRLERVVLIEDAEAFAHVPEVMSWSALLASGSAFAARLKERRELVSADNPAALVYTSGTTGSPKGVVLTHENLMWQTEGVARMTGVPVGITSISYLPLAHVAEQVLSLYLPLRVVGHVYFCPEVSKAVEYVQHVRPMTFFGVPRVWEKMKAGLTARMARESSPLTRWLVSTAIDVGLRVVRLEQAGEPIPVWLGLLRRVFDALVLAKIREAIGLDKCTHCGTAAAPLPVEVGDFFAAMGLLVTQGYGMTECAGLATVDRREDLEIGSVGHRLPGVEVTLAEDQEVIVRGPICSPGYWQGASLPRTIVDADGWLHTGDIGRIDDHGRLWIVDRKKEIIVTAGGKNVAPVHIESLLKEHPLIGEALVYGDRRPYLVALIVLDVEVTRAWAEGRDLSWQNMADLTAHPEIVAQVQQAVDAANGRLARVEQVKKVHILKTQWQAGCEELTPTMKLRRRVIHATYQEEIEALYGSKLAGAKELEELRRSA